jgi:probable HAF family extracellular repeat protein
MKTHPRKVSLVRLARFLSLGSVSVLALVVLPARVHANPPLYNVTVLGGLGGIDSRARSINALGQVAGSSLRSGNSITDAVWWTGVTPTDLVGLGGRSSAGNGINDFGQVVGLSYLSGNSALHAVLWTGTTPTDLGTLGGPDSVANGINNSGQIVGSAWVNGSQQHAVRWTGTTHTPTDLGTPLGGPNSYGNAINASGQVAGAADLPDGRIGAVMWNGTAPTVLGSLSATGDSQAFGINTAGQIVGVSKPAFSSSSGHAVLWTGTTPTDLGTLGGVESRAYAINDLGDVTGISQTTGTNSYVAFLYTGGTMYDLLSLVQPGSGITNLSVAGGSNINNVGQIAAHGFIGAELHALLLTPTPEPASAALLLVGGALLGLRRRPQARCGGAAPLHL